MYPTLRLPNVLKIHTPCTATFSDTRDPFKRRKTRLRRFGTERSSKTIQQSLRHGLVLTVTESRSYFETISVLVRSANFCTKTTWGYWGIQPLRRRISSCTEPFLMILDPIENVESALSNGTKITQNDSVQLETRSYTPRCFLLVNMLKFRTPLFDSLT